jgi:basic amino acid/polyamine antiporter, APA family
VASLTRPYAPARRPRPPVVRRTGPSPRITRGWAGLTTAAYPRAGAATAICLGIVATHGGALTPVAVLIAGLVFAAVAAALAEGIAMFPELSSPAGLARHAFGELAGVAAAWASALGVLALAAAGSVFAAHYLSVFWAPLGRSPGDAVAATAVLALAAAYRLAGLPRSGAAGLLTGAVAIVVLTVLAVLGAAFAFHPHLVTRGLHVGSAPSWHGLLLASALAALALATTDAVGEMADDARDPDRDLPRAVPGVAGLQTALAVALALVVLMARPVDASAPLLGISSGLGLKVLATGMRDLVGLAVAALLVVCVQSALATFARHVRRMAERGLLPTRTAAARSDGVPVAAVAAGAIAAAGLVVLAAATGGAALLVGAAVYGGLIATTAALAAVVAMRVTDPLRYRPFRVPLGLPIDGRRIPLPAVAAALTTALLWLAVVVYAPGPRWVGSAWMLLGLAGYAAYGRRRGLGLGEHAPRRPAPGTRPGTRAPRIAVEFRTILIPANTDLAEVPADAVEVAARLAAERRASVVLLAFTVIPLGEELDMELDDLDERVERLAAQARAIGESYGIRVHVSHLRTRDPAESILSEAARRNSQVILLGAAGLQQRRFRRVTHDGAVRRIVAEAGQRVMIIQPAAVRG